MSFDWMSFGTGFLERTQEIREQRATEAKEYEREQRDAARRNAATISRRRAVVDQVTGYANYLRSNGATEEQLQAAISAGPQAIQEFTTAVQAAVQRNGGRPLGASDIDTIIRMPAGFEGVNMPFEDFVRQTYGLATTTTEAPEQEEFGLLDRIGGRDLMSRAEGRLRATPFMEGMTIEQINEAAMQGDYQSMLPGTFATFAGDTRYTADDGSDFLRDYNQRMDVLEDNPEYKDIEGGMDAVQERQRTMRQTALTPLIMEYARQDPDGFMRLHETQLRMELGDEYVNGLRETLGLDAPEPEDNGGDTGGAGTDTGGDEGEIIPTSTELPAGTPIPEPPATPQPQVEPAVATDEFTPFQEGQNGGVTPLVERPTSAGRRDRRVVTGGDTPTNAAGSRGRMVERDAQNAERALIDSGVDPQQIQVLQSSGADIQDYVIRQGATTEVEIEAAVREYAQQEGIELPDDISVIVYALKTSMPN